MTDKPILAMEDEALYETLMSEPQKHRGIDPESMRQKFFAYALRALGVLVKKQTFTIEASRIMNGAIKSGIFGDLPKSGNVKAVSEWVASRRHQASANFYDGLNKGSLVLPSGWTLVKVGRRNYLQYKV